MRFRRRAIFIVDFRTNRGLDVSNYRWRRRRHGRNGWIRFRRDAIEDIRVRLIGAAIVGGKRCSVMLSARRTRPSRGHYRIDCVLRIRLVVLRFERVWLGPMILGRRWNRRIVISFVEFGVAITRDIGRRGTHGSGAHLCCERWLEVGSGSVWVIYPLRPGRDRTSAPPAMAPSTVSTQNGQIWGIRG